MSVLLQLTYITKFFHWEMGYMNSMDIQHDRAGFYLCWGCLVRQRSFVQISKWRRGGEGQWGGHTDESNANGR